jgi:RNA polymerase sigma-70 factor (ECF subfamily)
MHVHEDMGETLLIVDENTLHDRLEYSDLEKWMDNQIESLPTTSRIVLTMRQLEHRELSEIADILGIKQSSVSTLLARARNELRNKLKRRNK